jgi:hypothetical protein
MFLGIQQGYNYINSHKGLEEKIQLADGPLEVKNIF